MAFWVLGIFTLFLTRGFMYSTWSTQGPAVRGAMDIDLATMGWYAACLSIGSVTGVLISERLLERVGSRAYSLISYTIMATALMLLGLNLEWGLTPVSFLITAIFGLPLGMGDYVNNIEATHINREAGRNRVPLLYGGFSLGFMVGSALVGVAISAGLGLASDFLVVGIVMLLISIVASFFIDKNNGKAVHLAGKGVSPVKIRMRDVITEKRSRRIALIAFAFVLAEGVGVVWTPIILVQNGFSTADAAFGFTLFGLGFVIMRLVGGPIADRIGRKRVVLYSAITASAGIVVFILTPWLEIPLVGSLLWGLGNSIGLAMATAALGDDAARSAARMTFLWTIVYVANLVVGPTIGLLSGVVGLLGALALPLIFLILAALSSNAVSEDHPESVGMTSG